MNFIPSGVTLLNLCFGVISLVYTLDNNLRAAAVCIIISVLLDGMDGRVARRFNASSDFGKELDSLADMVSFGVAPAILIIKLTAGSLVQAYNVIIPAVCVVFVLCGAYRLARFNILDISDHFVGIPITAAGGLIALVVLILPFLPPWFFILLVAVLAWLMVSRITVPKY